MPNSAKGQVVDVEGRAFLRVYIDYSRIGYFFAFARNVSSSSAAESMVSGFEHFSVSHAHTASLKGSGSTASAETGMERSSWTDLSMEVSNGEDKSKPAFQSHPSLLMRSLVEVGGEERVSRHFWSRSANTELVESISSSLNL